MNSIEKTQKLRHRRLEVEKCAMIDIKTLGGFTLVESHKWYGIRSGGGQILLEPIYDSIDMMDDACTCIVKVKNTYLLYSIADGRFVDISGMISYKCFGYLIEITTHDGVGLYCCRTQRMLVPSRFQEITHTANGRYLWVKTVDDEYAFYDTQAERIVKCPRGTDGCLDGPGDYMFVVVDHRVHCLDETGTYAPDRLRAFALQSKGRINLSNHNRHISIITDVYGKIIN